jgi:hypothetical protein
VPFAWNRYGEGLVVQIDLSEVKHTTSNIVIWELDKSQLRGVFRTVDSIAIETHPDDFDVAGLTEIPRHFCLR